MSDDSAQGKQTKDILDVADLISRLERAEHRLIRAEHLMGEVSELLRFFGDSYEFQLSPLRQALAYARFEIDSLEE